MLLSKLISQYQETYADIQARIEDLQEQQRKIQAHLQQLGSVESQMVSAVQMLQEAISSINEVCPSELAEYQQTVVGLFSSPVAILESSQPDPEPEPQPDPAPSPEPEQPSNIVQFPGNATVEVKATEPKIITTTFYGHIGRGGHDHIVWRVSDNDKALQVFRRLNIKPSDISLTPAKNCNAGKGYFYDGEDCNTAIVTSKAFMKLINDGDMTRDKVLDD